MAQTLILVNGIGLARLKVYLPALLIAVMWGATYKYVTGIIPA